ncbi:hypothetical protein GJ689_12115 [Rhodoplanes serenus]|uniref:Uncharacterized protein n=1 Tax=Rhodoplanes serenus TaxID=200615 RepID=A0A9X4XKU1_9BRAD|nr:hypothetical protein [Rhodoplanes serenus]MTW16950.1 hypothetical protein [Rhodoplanes serenus]
MGDVGRGQEEDVDENDIRDDEVAPGMKAAAKDSPSASKPAGEAGAASTTMSRLRSIRPVRTAGAPRRLVGHGQA